MGMYWGVERQVTSNELYSRFCLTFGDAPNLPPPQSADKHIIII